MRRKHQAGEPSHGRTVTRGHLAHGGIILRGDLLHREHTQEAESTRGRETDLAEPQKSRGDYMQKKREVDDVAVWLGGPRNFPANSQDHQQEAQAILVGRGPVAAAAPSAAAPGGAAAHAQLRGVGQMQPAWQGVAGPASGGRQACALPTRGGHGGAPPHCPRHRLATRPGEVPAPQGVLGPRGESRPGLRPSLTWALQLAL